MTAEARAWTVRLTAAAEADFQRILRWTKEQFGDAQAHIYTETLSMALEALAAGPRVIAVKARDDIAKGLFSLHVARAGRKGRHFVMFRIAKEQDDDVIEVLRLLHDSMDLPRQLSGTDEST